MLKARKAKRDAKRLSQRLATASNHARIMGNRKWAVLVIGQTVCRFSQNDIRRMVEILSTETATQEEIIGEVYQ